MMDEKDFDREFLNRGSSISIPETIEKLRDPHLEAVVTLMARPSAQIFIATVEWELYEPQTAANSLFQLIAIWWLEMAWRLIIYQKDDRRAVREIAFRFGLTLADGIPQKCEYQGIPCIVGTKRYPISPGAKMFPVNSLNLYTLEYHPNSNLSRARRIEEEQAALIKLYRRHNVAEETLIEMGLIEPSGGGAISVPWLKKFARNMDGMSGENVPRVFGVVSIRSSLNSRQAVLVVASRLTVTGISCGAIRADARC
jgi:hypothetical protein